MGRLTPGRSFHEEVKLQKARSGAPENSVSLGGRLDKANSDLIGHIELNSVNAGRDVKLHSEFPPALSKHVSRDDWNRFVENTNRTLKRYRAKRAESYLLGLSIALPPAAVLYVMRERTRERKIMAVLATACALFDDIASSEVGLHFDRNAAKRDLSNCITIRRMRRDADDDKVYGSDAGSANDVNDGEDELRRALAAEGLSGIADRLIDEGFDTLDRIRKANIDDLIASGIKRGHARSLLSMSRSTRLRPSEPSSESTHEPDGGVPVQDLLMMDEDNMKGVQPAAPQAAFNPFD